MDSLLLTECLVDMLACFGPQRGSGNEHFGYHAAYTNLSVATPAEKTKETFFCWCKFWAVKNFKILLKSAGEIFLSGLRGAKKISVAFRIVFRIFFRIFQTVFRIDLKVFAGAISFCRRAALTNRSHALKGKPLDKPEVWTPDRGRKKGSLRKGSFHRRNL